MTPTATPELRRPYKPTRITRVTDAAVCRLDPDPDFTPAPGTFGLLLLIDGEWQAFTLPLPDGEALAASIGVLRG